MNRLHIQRTRDIGTVAKLLSQALAALDCADIDWDAVMATVERAAVAIETAATLDAELKRMEGGAA